MKKYLGVIILITLQLITLFSFTQSLELESVLGVWTLIYLYVFYKKIFRLEGDNIISSSRNYDTVKGSLKARELYNSNKESPYSMKYFNTKWIYLCLSITNGITCFIIIKG